MHTNKRFLIALALTLMAGLVWGTQSQAANTYNNLLDGRQATAPKADSASFTCEAQGDLPKLFTFTVEYDRLSQTITGGSWTLVVSQQGTDGALNEVGTLSGTVSGGTVTLSPKGKMASIESAQLIINGGDGSYVGVAGGSGILEGTSTSESPITFNGRMSLTF